MPTVSVKLAEKTKLKLGRLAASQGVTAHAIMVDAIESALSRAEDHSAFVADALRSRKKAVASGEVIDGAAFADYLKAKARGIKVTCPKAVRIDTIAVRA